MTCGGRLGFIGGALLACLLPLCAAVAAPEPYCVNADPSGVLSGITGDFELSIDPQDPAQHVIFLSNVSGDWLHPQRIVVAQLDPKSGQAVPGTLTVVASNYFGDSDINGPSWMETPEGQLGIIYAGAGGVHGAYRSANALGWSDFLLNWDHSPTFGSPSVLPNTSNGAYAGNPVDPPGRAATYPQYEGSCTTLCYAAYNGGKATDVGVVLAQHGYEYASSTQAVLNEWLYVSACPVLAACGIYQAKIDGAGGLTDFRRLAETGRPGQHWLAATRHPVTGTTIIFSADAAGYIVYVWEQAFSGEPLVFLGAVPTTGGAGHFRGGASNTQVVLNYFIKEGRERGSYTIPVSAVGSRLVIGNSREISPKGSGSEFGWFPAANHWAIVYRKQTQEYIRCWVEP